MAQVEVLDARPDLRGGYRVDVTRGERIGRVSSEWFNRPADERYLSLAELMASVKGRAERSRTRTVESAAVRVEASRDNAERLELVLPGSAEPIAPTHWSFGQLAGLVGAPASYPVDQLIALQRGSATELETQPIAAGVEIERLQFRYRLHGDRAPWRPVRAYDDGSRVYIEFPAGIAQAEMPPLFVVGADGRSAELVNYRVRGRHMIVDRLFGAAELRLGAERRQQRVRIERTDGSKNRD